MSKLQTVRQKARLLGIVGQIDNSTKKGKKYMITLDDGHVVHFGQLGYEDFIDHKDEERRKRYLARASKIKNKAGQLTANDKHSPNYYAIKLLW